MIIASNHYYDGKYDYAFPLVKKIEETFPNIPLIIHVWRDSGFEHLDDEEVEIEMRNNDQTASIILHLRWFESSLGFGDVYDDCTDDSHFHVYTEDGIDPLIHAIHDINYNIICSVGAIKKGNGFVSYASLFSRDIIAKQYNELIDLLSRKYSSDNPIKEEDIDMIRILFWDSNMNTTLTKST